MTSDAVGSERISKIVGYKLDKGDFSTTTPNLPQRIAVLAEANETNQSGLDLTPWQLTTAQEAGVRYGFGSPIYHIARILKPISGDGVGGIPVIYYPQAKASGATAKVLTITPTGVATDNATHTLVVAGRTDVDGFTYDFQVNQGDTTADLTDKIMDALNKVLGCPFIGTSTDYVATATSKWKGLTANGLSITVDMNGKDVGITYAVVSSASGSGTPDVGTALALFGNNWNTIVVNSYGAVSAVMNSLESTNGIPDPLAPTGRYAATLMKPFISIQGSVLDDPSSITDSRLNNVTIAIAPAPLSAGLEMEAAANMTVLAARQFQDQPHLDVSSRSYPDMPTPTSVGSMASYDSRDAIVKKGCSTVDLVGGRYQVEDFVTTYHPVGEIPPQFRYCRNLNIDFNIRYRYYLLELTHVVGHSIANDNDIVSVDGVVKPKTWKQELFAFAEDLTDQGLTVDSTFMQNGTIVNISNTNPDRLETAFPYKRSGYVRIASTTGKAGFNFGTLN